MHIKLQKAKEWVQENSTIVASAAVVAASAVVVYAGFKLNEKNFELLERRDTQLRERAMIREAMRTERTNALQDLIELRQSFNRPVQ